MTASAVAKLSFVALLVALAYEPSHHERHDGL
jgi:hypothetical protein